MIVGELCESFPPTCDGVGRVAMEYCHGLAKRGHTVYYIAPMDAAHSHVEGLNCLLYRSVHIPGQNYQYGLPMEDREFVARLDEIPFDLLHLHSPFQSWTVAKHVLKTRPVPLVTTFHSKYYDDFLKATHSKMITNAVVRKIVNVYRRCDEVWTVNSSTADVLRGYGFDGAITVVSNGTDLVAAGEAEVDTVRRKYGVREGCPVFLYVGQIDCKKNLPMTLEACALLKERGQDFELLLVGMGPDQETLEKERARLGLEKQVHFLGFINNDTTLRSLYTLSDLFIFPSVYDTFGLVVREAAAAGTPALMVKGSCCAEGVRDGVDGFLCENTPASLADRIVSALPLKREVGLEASRSLPVTWDQVMDEAEARYDALCRKKSGQLPKRPRRKHLRRLMRRRSKSTR